MQEILPNSQKVFENLDSVKVLNDLKRTVNKEDGQHCLTLAVDVPEWQIEFLYRYENYNQLFTSIGNLF